MELVLSVIAVLATAAAVVCELRRRGLAARVAVLETRLTALDASPDTAVRAHRWMEHLAWLTAVQARSPSQRALDDLLALRSTRVEVLDVGERHMLDGAIASTEQALRLHDALAAWASTPTVEAEPAPLDTRTALDKALTELDDDGKVTLDVVGLPRATADGDLLATVLLAALDNCVRYRWPGRPVQVELDTRETPDGRVAILVRDDGLGVDVGAQEHLFLPFSRGNGATAMPGVGLGLATIARAMEAMDGTARFVEHEGRGSTLELSLPAG